jgi:hypothetical protein
LARRKSHPDRHIEAALRCVESHGWTVEKSAGGAAHPWGTVKCPYSRKSCRCGVFCRISIWGTPKNPESFAKKIRSAADKCVIPKQKLPGQTPTEE